MGSVAFLPVWILDVKWWLVGTNTFDISSAVAFVMLLFLWTCVSYPSSAQDPLHWTLPPLTLRISHTSTGWPAQQLSYPQDVCQAMKAGGKLRDEFLESRRRHMELLLETGGKKSRMQIFDSTKVVKETKTELQVAFIRLAHALLSVVLCATYHDTQFLRVCVVGWERVRFCCAPLGAGENTRL